MTISEFLRNEIESIANEEMDSGLSTSNHEQITDLLNSFPADMDLENFWSVISNEPLLKSVKSLKSLISFIGMEDIKQEMLEAAIKNNPKNRIYPLLWVFWKIEVFRNDEFLDSDYAAFLFKLIRDYDYLFKLDNFLFETNLLLLKPHFEPWDEDVFYPVFELAERKIPEKHAFTYLYANLLFHKKDYLKAIILLDKLIQDVQKKSLENGEEPIGSFDFSYPEYLEAIEMCGLCHFRMGNYEKALSCFDVVVHNLPVIYYDESEEDDVMTYLHSFLARITIYLTMERKQEATNDYARIKDYLGFYDDLAEEYPEVFSSLRISK